MVPIYAYFAKKRCLPNRQERFEIFIYSNATREDDKTELFKSIVPQSSAHGNPGKIRCGMGNS